MGIGSQQRTGTKGAAVTGQRRAARPKARTRTDRPERTRDEADARGRP